MVVDELLHRHQLERRDAEAAEVVDDGRVGNPRIRAAQLVGDVGMTDREATHVRLVDDRLVHRLTGLTVVAPVEERVTHEAERHVRGAVGRVRTVVVCEVVGEAGGVPVDLPLDRLGIRVEQQLGRIAPQPTSRIPRTVDAISVALARPDVGQVGVPAVRVDLGELDAFLVDRHHRTTGVALGIAEEAQLDAVGDGGEQREVRPRPVVGGAEGIGLAGPTLARRRHDRRIGRRARRPPPLRRGHLVILATTTPSRRSSVVGAVSRRERARRWER